MKNLLSDLGRWRKKLKSGPLAIFLDYDGTLSAIAQTPEEAILPSRTRQVLEELVKLQDVKVAIVSGRALRVLKKLVGVRGLSYVGSHGLEFYSPGGAHRKLSREYCRTLRELRWRILSSLRRMPGVILENKPVSFAVHYRMAAPPVRKKARRLVRELCSRPLRQGEITLMQGKKVIEIIPPNAMNKGEAAKRLLRRWGKRKFLPVFMGDDWTDETAFAAFKGNGLTVRVGGAVRRSNAAYYVGDVSGVRLILERILCWRIGCDC